MAELTAPIQEREAQIEELIAVLSAARARNEQLEQAKAELEATNLRI